MLDESIVRLLKREVLRAKASGLTIGMRNYGLMRSGRTWERIGCSVCAIGAAMLGKPAPEDSRFSIRAPARDFASLVGRSEYWGIGLSDGSHPDQNVDTAARVLAPEEYDAGFALGGRVLDWVQAKGLQEGALHVG